MKIPGAGYPCALCGKPMHDTAEGRGFIAAGRKFVTCLDCGKKVEVAARTTATAVKSGLQALVQTKAPGLLPILKQLHAAYVESKEALQ